MSKERLGFDVEREMKHLKKIVNKDDSLTLSSRFVKYLIGQDERVQELEKWVENERNIAGKAQNRADRVEKQNKRYREAIEKIKNKVSQQLEGLDAEEEMERVIKLSELMSISIEALEGEE